MELYQLRQLVAFVKYGTLSKAAYTTQPSSIVPTVQMLLFLFLTFVDALRYTSTNVQNTAAVRCTNIQRLHHSHGVLPV